MAEEKGVDVFIEGDIQIQQEAVGGDSDVLQFGLDPFFTSYRKIYVSDLKQRVIVRESTGVFKLYLHNHPLGRVELAGLLISLDRKAKRFIVHIDDGTGLIRCTKLVDSIDNYDFSCFRLGCLVLVKGSVELSETNQEKYGLAICIQSISVLDDPNLETFHMLRTLQLMKQVYS